MGERMGHQLTFGPVGRVDVDQDSHLLSGKSADVADFVCPCCGLTLFVFYRVLPPESETDEHQKEGNEK